MTDEGTKERICPVCDDSVPFDAKSCPSCKTDLTLFQVNGERVELEEDVEMVGQVNGHVGDLLKAANGDPFTSPAPAEASVEMFECPECTKLIPEDASACPHCGVEFAEGEVFECPLCQTLVDINVDVCPSCGAEFGDEEEGEEIQAEPEIAPEPVPEPEPEPPKEMSFAERMKAMKETTATSQPAASTPEPAKAEAKPEAPKEMSFAERMKAMKEGKASEAGPDPTPEPAPAKEEQKPSPVAEEPVPEAQPAVQAEVKPEESAPAPAVKTEPAAPTPSAAPTPAPAPVAPVTDKSNLKEKYKELPKLIGEVKKYLAVAKICEVDVSKSRGLINQAVAAGKSKDLETAVRLVEEGKAGIEHIISEHLKARIDSLNAKIGEADGQVSPIVSPSMAKIQESIGVFDFETVLSEIEKVESLLKETVGEDVLDAKSVLRKIGTAVEDAQALNIEMGEGLKLYNEAKKAADSEDWNSAALYAKQAQDSLNEILPAHITTAMKKAKTSLLEIKMMNIDIAQPVEFLKQANIAMKEKKYADALHSVKEFKDFLDKENYVM